MNLSPVEEPTISTPVRALVSRVRRFLARHLICRFVNHRLGTDRGVAIGAKLVDRWCARCDKHIQIPLEEEDYDSR